MRTAADVDGVGHQPRVAAHERDARSVHGHVGAGAHGNAHVGRGQRGCIVDAVAHHGHAGTAALQFAHDARLFTGQHFGADVVHAQLFTQVARCAGVVAADQHGTDAHEFQLRDGLGRTRLGAVAKRQPADEIGPACLAAHASQVAHGVALGLQDGHLIGACRQIQATFLHPACAAQAPFRTADLPGHTAPGDGPQVLCRHSSQPLRCVEYGHRKRVRAAGLQCGGMGQQRVPAALQGTGVQQPGLADSERAGLVPGDHRDGVRQFQRLRVLDEHAALRRHACAGHDGRRRGQAQRARAGDDQHGHGMQHGRMPVTDPQAPAQQGDQCHHQHHGHKDRAHLVHQALDRRLLPLCRFHQPHDARQHAFRAQRGGLHQQQAFAIDGATGDALAHCLGHRQALASDERLVHVAGAFDHSAVHRQPFARAHHHQFAALHLGQRQVGVNAVAAHPGRVRPQALQRADGLGGLATRAGFQPLAQEHQGDDDSRTFEVQLSGMVSVRSPAMQPQHVHAQAIGRAGAQRHQQVHVAGTCPHRAPARLVEACAQPELHRRGQQPLPKRRQHQVSAFASKGHGQHGQHQGRGQQRGQRHAPTLAEPGACGRRGRAGGFGAHAVARLAHGGGQGWQVTGTGHRDAGGLGGQVDVGAEHARHFLQRLLHPAHAGRAGHVLHRELQGHCRQRVSGPLHGLLQGGRFKTGGRCDGQRVRGQVHVGFGNARHGACRLFHTGRAGRAGHALHRPGQGCGRGRVHQGQMGLVCAASSPRRSDCKGMPAAGGAWWHSSGIDKDHTPSCTNSRSRTCPAATACAPSPKP